MARVAIAPANFIHGRSFNINSCESFREAPEKKFFIIIYGCQTRLEIISRRFYPNYGGANLLFKNFISLAIISVFP